MSNSVVRYVTAIVAVPLIYILIVMAPKWGFYLVVTVTFLLALWEWLSVLDRIYARMPKTFSLVVCGSILFLGFPQWFFKKEYMILMPFILSFLGTALFWISSGGRDMKRCAGAFSGMFLSIYVVSMAGLSLMHTRSLPGGKDLLLYVLCVVWLSDAGAMHIGRLFGRRRLTPVISPNKTVEGFFGALFTGWIGAAVYMFFFNEAMVLNWGSAFITAPLLVIAAHVGDLTVSIFKRAANVKDSGILIPGHGGFLDRLDNLLLSAPVLLAVVVIIG